MGWRTSLLRVKPILEIRKQPLNERACVEPVDFGDDIDPIQLRAWHHPCRVF